jgi:hypothetical protein
MDARKLRAAANGRVMTSDASSRSNIHIGSKSGKWTQHLRFNR